VIGELGQIEYGGEDRRVRVDLLEDIQHPLRATILREIVVNQRNPHRYSSSEEYTADVRVGRGNLTQSGRIAV
jgi:hypothetical protein